MTKFIREDADSWRSDDLQISVNETLFFNKSGKAYSIVLNGDNAGAVDGYAAINIKTFATKAAARDFAKNFVKMIEE